jgi:hypothetical protein
MEAWYNPTLVLALLRKLFTSIQNFDQLGVVLGRKRPSVLLLGIIYFWCKIYYFGNSKRILFIVYFRVDDFHVTNIIIFLKKIIHLFIKNFAN